MISIELINYIHPYRYQYDLYNLPWIFIERDVILSLFGMNCTIKKGYKLSLRAIICLGNKALFRIITPLVARG